MDEDVFEKEFMSTLGRLSAVVIVLIIIYIVFSHLIKLDRSEFYELARDSVKSAIIR